MGTLCVKVAEQLGRQGEFQSALAEPTGGSAKVVLEEMVKMAQGIKTCVGAYFHNLIFGLDQAAGRVFQANAVYQLRRRFVHVFAAGAGDMLGAFAGKTVQRRQPLCKI